MQQAIEQEQEATSDLSGEAWTERGVDCDRMRISREEWIHRLLHALALPLPVSPLMRATALQISLILTSSRSANTNSEDIDTPLRNAIHHLHPNRL